MSDPVAANERLVGVWLVIIVAAGAMALWSRRGVVKIDARNLAALVWRSLRRITQRR